MAEFEKLEQECIDKYSPNHLMGKKDQKNKKKKKLFDSDSEEDNYQEQ